MQPEEPYISIGYHRSLSELDPSNVLPVFRRMVGGGPVYIDDGQYFFQIVIPLLMAPARRAQAVGSLLRPAVEAFNDIGVPASLDKTNEVVVGDQKICGHAAGQIDNAVVVVGNLITRFDHEAAAGIVNAPSDVAHDEFLTQMRRFVTATPADPARFFEAVSRRYSESLDLMPEQGNLTDSECSQLEKYDSKFADPDWLNGVPRRKSGIWRVKIKSGVWVGSASSNGHRVTATFQGQQVLRIRLEGTDSAFPGMDQLLDEMAASPPI
jgi:lipoate-protein ligase A